MMSLSSPLDKRPSVSYYWTLYNIEWPSERLGWGGWVWKVVSFLSKGLSHKYVSIHRVRPNRVNNTGGLDKWVRPSSMGYTFGKD